MGETARLEMESGGLTIRGKATRACTVRVLDWEAAQSSVPPTPPRASAWPASESTWLELVLDQGMNRQVRRITQHAGHRTVRLVRMSVGRLSAESLQLRPGEWRYVERGDVLHDDDTVEDTVALPVGGDEEQGASQPKALGEAKEPSGSAGGRTPRPRPEVGECTVA